MSEPKDKELKRLRLLEQAVMSYLFHFGAFEDGKVGPSGARHWRGEMAGLLRNWERPPAGFRVALATWGQDDE